MFDLAYIGTTGFEFWAEDVHSFFFHSEFPRSKNERARILKLFLSLFMLPTVPGAITLIIYFDNKKNN